MKFCPAEMKFELAEFIKLMAEIKIPSAKFKNLPDKLKYNLAINEKEPAYK